MKLLHLAAAFIITQNLDKSFAIKNNYLREPRNYNVNNFQRALSQKDIRAFKSKHDLREEASLTFHIISTSNTVNVKGTTYSLDKLTPVNVFTKNATCLNNGFDISKDCTRNSSSFISYQGNEIIFATKDIDGIIRTIQILHEDGSETSMATVAKDVMAAYDILAEYDSEAIDDAKLGRYSLDADNTPHNNFKDPATRKLFPRKVQAHEYQHGGRYHGSYNVQYDRSLSSNDCKSFKIIEVAIAFDSSFCDAEGGYSNARDTIQNIIAGASLYYQQPGVCMKVELSHLEGFCDPATDPYVAGMQTGNIGCDEAGLLDWFSDFWNDNRAHVHKDAAHLFYHVPFNGNFAGCARVWGMSGTFDDGFGVESMDFSHDLGRRTTLFTHELGHNLGLGHTRNSNGDKYIMLPGKPRWGHHIWTQNDLEKVEKYRHRFPSLQEEPAD